MNQYIKLKWYQQSWLIALCFALWFFIIPLIAGIILLVLQQKSLAEQDRYAKNADDYIKRTKGIVDAYSNVEVVNKEMERVDALLSQRKAQADKELESYISRLDNNKKILENRIKLLKSDIEELYIEKDDLSKEISIAYYDFSSYDALTSQECKNKLALLIRQKN